MPCQIVSQQTWKKTKIYIYVYTKVKVKLLSQVQLFATPWTVAFQASPSMGFSRQEYLEWVAISFSRGFSQLRAQTQVSCIAGTLYLLSHEGSPICVCIYRTHICAFMLSRFSCV